jgi:hypothetical protein
VESVGNVLTITPEELQRYIILLAHDNLLYHVWFQRILARL